MSRVSVFISIVIISLIFVSYGADAQDKNKRDELQQASDFYKKVMERAHPTPEPQKPQVRTKTLAEPLTTPIFENVNTITPVDKESAAQNESSIAVNPTNPQNLIASAVDYRNNSETKVYVTHDGGRTWENKFLGHVEQGWRSSNDPSVAFDAEGVAYLCYGGFGNTSSGDVLWGENGVFIARSFDEGRTWEAHIPVIKHEGQMTLDSVFEDKYYISVDNSPESPYYRHIYNPWKRMSPRDSATQIVLSKSTDQGAAWSTPVPVSPRKPGTSLDTTYGQSFPLAATGPEGTVYCVWNDGIVHGVGFAKSTNGSKSFTEPEIIHHYEIFGETKLLEGQGYLHAVKDTVRAEAYPVIDVDIYDTSPRKGTIYLCWSADRVPNIYFSKSTDKGETWTEPVIVHSDTTNDQFWQWMDIDPMNGDLAIMYLDSRNDPDNILTECYVSYSSDGGETWIDRPASDMSSDLRQNPFRRQFAGDYNGLAFYDGIIYPSWVDMRNAEDNINDDDVFTAIVNTRAPKPPKNFEVQLIPEEPDRLVLSWQAPAEKVFGQELKKEDFHYVLYRDGEEHKEVESSENSLLDSSLTPFEKYQYSLCAVVDEDTSRKVTDSSFAGGAKEPKAPKIVYKSGSESNEITLMIRMPSRRIDDVTPLVSLDKAYIYRDSELYETLELEKSDTSKIIKFTDNVDEEGYYRYKVKIRNSFDNPDIDPQESDFSSEEIVFAGKIENSFTENFDSPPLPRYLITGDWGTADNFAKSAPFSMTESPDGNYEDRQNTYMLVFPVLADSEFMQLSFWHAALVSYQDSAIVEYSVNNTKDWEILEFYNQRKYEPWGKDGLNSEDWKRETIDLPEMSDDTLFVRFRFTSNAFMNNDGWYIDDATISEASSVKDSKPNEGNMEIYPNPSSDILNIYFYNMNFTSVKNISLFNIFGREISVEKSIKNWDKNSLTIDVSNLNSGVYILNIQSANDKKFMRKIIISK